MGAIIILISGAVILRVSGLIVQGLASRMKYRGTHREVEEQQRRDIEKIEQTRKNIERGIEYLRNGHRNEKKSMVGEINKSLEKISALRSNFDTQEERINQNIKEYVDKGILTKRQGGLLEAPELSSLDREQSSSIQKWITEHNAIIKGLQGKRKSIDHTEAELRGFRASIKKDLRNGKHTSQMRGLPGDPVEDALKRAGEKLGQKWAMKNMPGALRGKGRLSRGDSENLRGLLEGRKPEQSAKLPKPANKIPSRRTR